MALSSENPEASPIPRRPAGWLRPLRPVADPCPPDRRRAPRKASAATGWLVASLLGVAAAATSHAQALLAPAASWTQALSGATDARRPFALLLDRELRAASGGSAAGAWLHTPVPPAADHARAIRGIGEAFAGRARSTSVLVVPGLFGDCVEAPSLPFGDGDARPRGRSLTEAYRVYADLGLNGIRALSLPGRATSAENGRRIAEAIRLEAARPGVDRLVIIAYSKGVPDTLHALAQLQAAGGVPPALRAVVSVAGAVRGTPLADHAEGLFAAVSPWVQPFDCGPSQGRELSSLTQRERVAWLAANPLAPGPRYYSIVAHAGEAEMAPALRPFHLALSAADPRNDGQLYAADTVLPGSTLLAEVRADHWDVALPRDRSAGATASILRSGRDFPREALFRATIRWVLGAEW